MFLLNQNLFFNSDFIIYLIQIFLFFLQFHSANLRLLLRTTNIETYESLGMILFSQSF
jgi:hypothetical protein